MKKANKFGAEGGQVIHQNVHSDLFCPPPLFFKENKCFKKILSHPGPPALGWGWYVCAVGPSPAIPSGWAKRAGVGVVLASFGMTTRAIFSKASLSGAVS